jgi:hypothetical protein
MTALVDLDERLKRFERATPTTEDAKKIKDFRARIFNFPDVEAYTKFKNICKGISLKDETFKYYTDDKNIEVLITSNNKDDLHKRGTWLVKKTEITGLKYSVL